MFEVVKVNKKNPTVYIKNWYFCEHSLEAIAREEYIFFITAFLDDKVEEKCE